jgi:cytochrome c553
VGVTGDALRVYNSAWEGLADHTGHMAMTMNRQAHGRAFPPDHHRRGRWRLLGVLMLWVSTALAAAPGSSADETPSAAQGQLIAVGGGPGGAGAACFSCHGLQGQGDAGGAFPRLAGLDAHYLARQLDDYAAGARADAVMTPISRQLSQADRRSVALYYAGLPAQAAQVGAANAQASLIQRGAILYAQGSAEHGIQACANCHGPGGRGLSHVYPSIAGQPPSYVETQLRRWQAGVRRNDIADLMGSVARRMTDEDIRAVSAYVAGLAP